MLPDKSTGQSPGTLARKLSRCKEGMAHFLPSWYKFCELYECRGTRLIGAANLSPFTKLVAGTGAIAVQALRICLGCRSKSKKCDKQLTFIVRVRRRSNLLIVKV